MRKYGEEYKAAKIVLSSELGKFKWLTCDYQAFTYKSDDVSLVFYPHKTTAGNHHIRVRNQNSKNKDKAYQLMKSLYDSSFDCTFKYKT